MSVRLRPRTHTAARALAHPYVGAPAQMTLRERVATALDRWAAMPRRTHNRHAVIYAAAVGLIAIGLSWTMADRVAALRLIALGLFAAHVMANKAIIGGLTRLREHGMPEAGQALDVYLGPGQLSGFEIALIWIGVAVFAPLLDVIAPAVTLAG